MANRRKSTSAFLLAALIVAVGYIGGQVARAVPPQKAARTVQRQLSAIPSTSLPETVQLLNADTNPTIRIPVSHSSLNWTLVKPRIRGSFGWMEIDRSSIRYVMSRQLQTLKEPDQGFQFSRTEPIDLKMEFNAAAFRARGLRHWWAYSPPDHWDVAASQSASVNSVSQADSVYNPFILRALGDFDGVVAEIKSRQQAAAPAGSVLKLR